MRIICLALGFSTLLASCASGPPPRIYLLAAPAQASSPQAANAAPVQLQTVLLPDYLDTTDILSRAGPHELAASRTANWGERLSQGITHALQAGLESRLPAGSLTLNPPASASAAQVLVTVDAFDAWPDGHCVLAAHWTILRSTTDAGGQTGQASFTSPLATNADDAARVAAMAGVVDQLSARIALALQRPGV